MGYFTIFLKSFKNFVNTKIKTSYLLRAQASVEYIVLSVAIIGLLTVWLGGLFPNLRDSLKSNFFDSAVSSIIDGSGDGGDGGDGGDHGDGPGDHGDNPPPAI